LVPWEEYPSWKSLEMKRREEKRKEDVLLLSLNVAVQKKKQHPMGRIPIIEIP
jgi:hypothetical protein